MVHLFVDVHAYYAKLTLFDDDNCFLIASTVNAYSQQQMLLMVVEDGRTWSSRNTVDDDHSSRFDIAGHGSQAATNPNMRHQFHMSWWNSKILKSSTASLERLVYHFCQYESNWISNLIFLCTLTNVILQLPCLVWMSKAVLSTFELVFSVSSVFVHSFNFGMRAFASNCFPIEHVTCSAGWQRTCWQRMNMMPGLPVCSIPQCKYTRYNGSCQELFQASCCFGSWYIEAHQELIIICKVTSHELWITTHSLLENITTFSKEVFKELESNLAVWIRSLGDTTRQTA